MATGSQGFSLAQGAFIGAYRVLEPLGRNALGEKYLVRNNQTRRNGVLTVVGPSAVRPGLVEELQALANLEHAAIARIEPPAEDRGQVLVPGEYVEGIGGGETSLADELAKRGGALAEEVAEPLLRSLVDALAYGHGFRGTGRCHGSLSPRTVALTKQGHPRLLDYGFSALAGEASVAGDIRALGQVVAATTGGGGRWQKVVEGCRAAGTPGGFGSAREVLAAFDQAEASRGRKGLAALAAILVVLAVGIGIGVAVLLRKPAPPVATTPKMPEKTAMSAADQAQLEQNLAAAERAIAKAEPELARRFLDRVIAQDARNARALKLLGDLDTEAGMARVGAVKDKADRLWGQVRQLEAVPSLVPEVARLGEQYRLAVGAYSGMDFAAAETRYGEFAAAAEALLARGDDRQVALRLKDEVEDARDAAEDARAALYAKDDWELGLARRQEGRVAFDEGDYPTSRKLREEARQVFADAARRGRGRAKVEVERKAYDAANEYADAELLAALPRDRRERLQRLVAEAGTLADEERFDESAVAWQKARTELNAALKDAAMEAGEKAPVIAAATGPRSTGELVVNGDLERGAGGQPEGWSILDGLTAKWSTQGKPGRCLEFDTGVLQVDKQRFIQEIAKVEGLGMNESLTTGPIDPNAAKDFQRSKGGQYETVGAHEGVWAFAKPVPVAPGDQYFVVEVDCLGPEKSTPLFYPQVFVRGFQKFDPQKDAGRSSWFHTPHPDGPAFSEQFGTDAQRRRARLGDYLMVYRHSLVCRNRDANIWEHYRMAFKLPDEPRFRPEVLLLKAYAMWPLGVYRFDNLRLRSVDEAEFNEISKQGHSIEGFMPIE